MIITNSFAEIQPWFYPGLGYGIVFYNPSYHAHMTLIGGYYPSRFQLHLAMFDPVQVNALAKNFVFCVQRGRLAQSAIARAAR